MIYDEKETSRLCVANSEANKVSLKQRLAELGINA